MKLVDPSSAMKKISIYTKIRNDSITFDHTKLKARLPVRSATENLLRGQLVVGWVTTSEYWLLNVLQLFFCLATVYIVTG